MRNLITFFLSLTLLFGLTSAVFADVIFETEPNNTFDTANKTVGSDNLGFSGYLMIGDIDTLSMFMTPNSQGEAFFAFDVIWSEGDPFPSPNPPQDRWLVVRLPVGDLFAQVGLEYNQAFFFYGLNPSPAQVYYLQIFSTLMKPDPITHDPAQGSMIAGEYRLTNIRGLNGTVVSGTAVPEPSGVLLALALTGSGLWIAQRSRQKIY